MEFTKDVVDFLIKTAIEAGDITLEYFQQGVVIEIKDNNSPVTLADQRAEEHILKAIHTINDGSPIVAEEAVAGGNIPDHNHLNDFWLIDPLDGTKEFIKQRPDYTVNIGYIKDKKAYFGIVYAPAKKQLYVGFADRKEAWMGTGLDDLKPITVRSIPNDGMTIVASKSHATPEALEHFLEGKTVKDVISRGSSLKFCSVAAGEADMYPRFGPTCEWDTAAGEAVLLGAGGEVVNLDGTPFRYAKRADFLNPGFIARALKL